MPDDRPLMNLPPPTRGQVLAELERELRLRATVYPVWVFNKKLKQHEADHRTACLRAAIAALRDYYEGGDGR